MAKARLDIVDCMLSLLHNDIPPIQILGPLEKVQQECRSIQTAALRSRPPLSRLNVDHWFEASDQPPPENEWIGCTRCRRPIDIRAQVATARLDVVECMLSLLHNEISVGEILRELEIVHQKLGSIVDAALLAKAPLLHINVDNWFAVPEETVVPDALETDEQTHAGD